jgi:hypothetical protein
MKNYFLFVLMLVILSTLNMTYSAKVDAQTSNIDYKYLLGDRFTGRLHTSGWISPTGLSAPIPTRYSGEDFLIRFNSDEPFLGIYWNNVTVVYNITDRSIVYVQYSQNGGYKEMDVWVKEANEIFKKLYTQLIDSGYTLIRQNVSKNGTSHFYDFRLDNSYAIRLTWGENKLSISYTNDSRRL